jgi:hypothetical protein
MLGRSARRIPLFADVRSLGWATALSTAYALTDLSEFAADVVKPRRLSDGVSRT